MSTEQDVLSEALSVLDIIALAKHLGIDGLKIGLNKSPFRDDKDPSFSIFKGGKMWKDHASGESEGLWGFARRALGLNEHDKNAIAACIKAAAGFDVNGPIHRAKVKPPAEKLFAHSPAWSSMVRDRFVYGVTDYLADQDAIERHADRRGWPVSFIRRLAEQELISYPPLPWWESSDKGAQRGIAFRVDSISAVGDRIITVPVGYHQRFQVEEKRKWVYVPYCPGNPRSKFQHALAEADATIQTYPFVMGNPAAKGWVIAEGQWDAATFALAAGKSFSGLVFGLRGIETSDLFFKCLHAHIQRVRPTVWLMPDNDAAGARMIERDPKRPDVPCFMERLKTAGVDKVVITKVKAEYGKDFNDLYRAKWITSSDIRAYAERLGVLNTFFAEEQKPVAVEQVDETIDPALETVSEGEVLP